MNSGVDEDLPRFIPPLVSLAATCRRPSGPKEDSDARSSGWVLCAAFLLGLGARLQVQVIGFLPFSELVVGLLFPLSLPAYTRRGALRSTRLLMPLCGLWLASTVITDLYLATEWSLAARGVARVLIYLVCIPFAVVFFGKDTWRRLIFFTLGLIPSVILSAFVFQSGAQIGREMVWGRALINFETHWVAVVVFAAQLINLLVYHRSKTVAYAASLFAGGLNFYNGSRSAGAAFAIGAPLAFARNFLATRRAAGRLSARGIAMFVTATALVAWGVIEAYSYSAREGLLGEQSRRKFEAQTKSAAGLLLTGRLEFVGAALAVRDSPFLGHGSWKLDTDRYYAQALRYLEIDADPRAYYVKGYPLIPSHSHLMGAWVENGLAGGIFWAYTLIIVARALYRPLEDDRHLRLWVSCTATALAWHILFSPISGRLETCVALAVFLTQADAAAFAERLRPRLAGARSA
ncbi:MAG: hypothetical protein ACKO1M_02100 [Planctomycetota bacterium]